MTTEQKSKLIDSIIGAARSAATLANKPFDSGDMWLKLIFVNDRGLIDLARKLGLPCPQNMQNDAFKNIKRSSRPS